MILHDLIIHQAEHSPTYIAVSDAEGKITYGELNSLANRFAHLFIRSGLQKGDRIGIWAEKSARVIAAMQGALRIGAIYVPLDPFCPLARIQTILQDCGMRFLITTRKRADAIQTYQDAAAQIQLFCLDSNDDWHDLLALPGTPATASPSHDDDIAYILYTSGSTGKPKGVCLSNRNALAFIEWAARILHVTHNDYFANHAPFHFDLSVLDLYAAFSCGATVVLVPETIAYLPSALAEFIIDKRITIWYSVPSVWLLMIHEDMLLKMAHTSLRAILFAGEPFPIKYLRQLYEQWPGIRYLNLYGPTETNVCTFYEVTKSPTDQTKPVPIGRACSGDHVWAQKDDGTIIQPGEEGELMVVGPTVMVGYWGQTKHGSKPYATGDIVRLQDDDNYIYVGRRDHMVKVRGYRIEVGDIEAALLEHAAIQEAAVLVVGESVGARIVAFLVCNDQYSLSLLDIKRHCATYLPRYMIVDAVRFLATLPRTRNGKIDYVSLISREHNNT